MNKQNASTKRPPAKGSNGKPQQPPQQKEESSNAPVSRISMWPLSASIWQGYNSEGQPYYTITLQRSWKDADGKWQYSDSFFSNDLLTVAELARSAFHKVNAMRQAERAEQLQPKPQQRYQAQDGDVPF